MQTIRNARRERQAIRQARIDRRADMVAATLGIITALVVVAPWIMLALQIPTRGAW